MNKSDNDILTAAQRWLEVFIVGAMFVLLGFFMLHQLAHTGFFTSAFGPFEMLCLYVPILVAVSAPITRAMTGQRNPARPLEAAGDLCLALGSLWLFIVFPFHYAHLADVLPSALRFLLTWLTDDIARIFLVLQILVAFISSIVIMLQYLGRARVAYAAGR